ncbi:MAG: hypothetical protein R3335_10005 [Anaerolineales bacterium]|nr:hypothetical protein [Anaerolineales bacterium]
MKSVADEIMLDLVNDRLIEIQSRWEGAIIRPARRELQEDGLLKVTMSVRAPDGADYSNLSWYQRKEKDDDGTNIS